MRFSIRAPAEDVEGRSTRAEGKVRAGTRGRSAAPAVAAACAAAAAGLSAALVLRGIHRIGVYPPGELRRLRSGATNPLFEAFPELLDRIPWRPLGTYPTPIEELAPPAGCTEGTRLFVKRDDASADVYGGNKVRKLEHFLAEAELAGRRTLVTLGGTGSNHALATALHGRRLGFEVDLVLYDQPVTPFVRANLRAFVAAGARVHHGRTLPASFARAAALMARRRREGAEPYFIMVGGTTPLGCLGHVAAAFELARQVENGEMPVPDRLFVPLGTCGTAVGLIVGLRLAGLPTRVIAVRVADPISANAAVVRWMAEDLARLLRRIDPNIPRIRFDARDFQVVTHHYGAGYGIPTAAGEAALRWAGSRLTLETTYSAKALAACLEAVAKPTHDRTFLFWNTFNSAAVPGLGALRDLPRPLAAIAAGP